MARYDYYKAGSNNVICDQCGKKFKAENLKLQWDGLWTCRRCFDIRNPQDYVRGVTDDTSPILSRPMTELEFTQEAQDLPLPT